jgi:hypothetical protein
MLSAQEPSPCGSVGGANVAWGGRSGHPFTATVRVTTERKLYDGNVIHTAAVLQQARDSAGRVRAESVNGCALGDNGQRIPMMRISVEDGRARSYESWVVYDDAPKTAEINHYSPAPTPSKEELQRQYARAKAERAANPIRTENLGTRMIAGVLAEGTRTIRTTPIGETGNALPIEFVEEQWISHDVGVVLLRTSDNPLNGHQTVEVTELTMAEPDAAMFSPPADYKVMDHQLKIVEAPGAVQAGGQ